MTDNLRELALAANRLSPVDKQPVTWFDTKTDGDFVIEHEDDREFVAAASPDAILALIKRAEDAEAEVERLTALEEATRKANLDCMDHYNEARAELARLKAQEPVAWLISSKDWWPESVAVTQKPTGLLGNETLQPLFLASGAARKETDQ